MEKSGEVSPSLLYHLIDMICNKGNELQQQDIKDKTAKIKSVLSSNIRLVEIKKEYTTSYRDKCSNKQRYPKVDLVIDLIVSHKYEEIPLKIIIENKVYSREHDNQTDIYYAYFSGDDNYIKNKHPEICFYKNNNKKKNERVYKKPINELQLFVFLHPQDYELESLARNRCEKFIPVSYQCLFKLLNSNISFLEREKKIIEEYKKIILRPIMFNDEKIYRTMAKDSEESLALKQFCKKYLPLFRLAMEEIQHSKDDKSLDGEKIAAIDQIIAGIDQYTGKRVKYDLIISQNELKALIMRKAADEIVKYLYETKRIDKEKLNELFPHDHWVCYKNEYRERKRKTKEDAKRFEKRWDQVGPFFVSSEWTKVLFDDFIQRVQREFPEIKISLYKRE